MNDKINQSNHEVKMLDRNFISLTGINKIVSFNDEEFLLESNMGIIHIKGKNLEVLKMDTLDGCLKIKGLISTINYMEETKKTKEESFIAKLFK